MTKRERERIVAAWREAVQPLIDRRETTQASVAEKLGSLVGRKVDQSNVSKWLVSAVPQEATIPAIRHMTRQVKDGEWPAVDAMAAPASGDPIPIWLPEWMQEAWLADARAAEKRATALLEFAVAARLESETAHDRHRMLNREEGTAAMSKAAVDRERRGRSTPPTGDTQSPHSPDRPEPETEEGSDPTDDS